MGTSACWDIILIFLTKHSDVYHVPARKLTLGQSWQWLAYGRSDICNVGPTLATSKKANSRFVNVTPPSARRLSSVYLPTLG